MDKIFEKIHSICRKIIKNEKLLNLVCKVVSKEVFLYLFFGVLTTVVNFVVFGILNERVLQNVLVVNAIAWLAAVIFAFITNKLFVFESRSWKSQVLLKEIPSFAGARLLTLGLEELGLLVLIETLHLEKAVSFWIIDGDMVIKIMISVVVVVLNYVFSKLLIFRKK